ncbi:MAG: hypothetical protein HQ546_11060 [Planctomycetes bacterium]|nr:hypothetical protein [Planctomycetota bacterium]
MIKNVYNISAIFSPSLNFIISEEVRTRLEQVQHIAFLEVKYEKLFNVPYHKGLDDGPPLDPDFPETLFNRYDHDRSLAVEIGHFFEMIVPRLRYVVSGFQDKVRIAVRCPKCSELRTEVSQSMLDEFPIVWESGLFMSQHVFSSIESYIDRDYFDCFELEVGDDKDHADHHICLARET